MTVGVAFAVVTSIVSLVQGIASAHRARKRQKHAKREAELRADLQKGLQFPEEAVAKSLAVVYGRQKIGGVRVHFAVRSNYKFAPPKPGAVVLEALSRKNPDPTDWGYIDALNGFDKSGLKYDADGNPTVSDPSRLKIWKHSNAPVAVYRFRGGYTPIKPNWKPFIDATFSWQHANTGVLKEIVDAYGLEPSSYEEFQRNPGYYIYPTPEDTLVDDRNSLYDYGKKGMVQIHALPTRKRMKKVAWVKPVFQDGKSYLPEHVPLVIYVPYGEGVGKPLIHPADLGMDIPIAPDLPSDYTDREGMSHGNRVPLTRDGVQDPSYGEYRSKEGEVRVWRITDAYDNVAEARLVESSVAEFKDLPGYICTEENPNTWKFPAREVKDAQIKWQVPTVDFVYAAFYGGEQERRPIKTLRELGFEWPDNESQKYPVMDRDYSGRKREFYFVQQALSFAGLTKIYGADVDGKAHTYDPFAYGMRMHIYPNGGQADPLMIVNDSSRADSRFDGVAYATMVFRLNRDDPQFGGTPEVSLYVEGNAPREVVFKNGTYVLGEQRPSNNPALLVLDHLLNPEYGKALPVDLVDLESFANAARICGTVMVADAVKRGTIWQSREDPRNVCLYECNATLDTARPVRERVQAILNTMLDAALVWSDGKYRLNFPYVFVYFPTLTYQVGDHVQVIDSNNRPRLLRCVQQSHGNEPLSSPAFWVEDVIPEHLRDINDDDLEIGSEVLIEWPDSDSKLNHLSIKFYNEDKDFAEDTASWPEKEPENPNDMVYRRFMEEDQHVKLESEITLEGCTTVWHAKAFAEHRVRMSRETNVYTFSGLSKTFQLEPGDLFGFSSALYNIPYCILRVESIETQSNGPIRITATTFDARLSAWNVADDQYVPLPDQFKGHTLKQAYNLDIIEGGTRDKSSGYTLAWSPAPDNRVVAYQVKYTTDRVANVTPSTAWVDIGRTSGTSLELPPLEGDYTFTVVSEAADGRIAPFRDLFEGSEWPLLGYSMTASHLEQGIIGVELTNSFHTLPARNGQALRYDHSNTSIFCYHGHTTLVYDGRGEAPGTYRVHVEGENITPGRLDKWELGAIIYNHSNMVGSKATVRITLNGLTPAGVPFTATRVQTLVTQEGAIQDGIFHIVIGPPVVYKDADALGKPGKYTKLRVIGASDIAGVIAPYGFVTYETNVTPESEMHHDWFEVQSEEDSQVLWYRFRQYSDRQKTRLLDEEKVIVMPRGERGPGAISAHLSNSSHVIPCRSDGTVITYDGAETSVYVFEGTERLRFVYGVEPKAGEYTGTADAKHIKVGHIEEREGVVQFSQYHEMTADIAVLQIRVWGLSSLGERFETDLLQTLVKVVQPDATISMKLSNPMHVFEKSSEGVIKTYEGSFTDITVFEGAEPLLWDNVGGTPGTYRLELAPENIHINAGFNKINETDVRTNTPFNMFGDKASITVWAAGKTKSGKDFVIHEAQQFVVTQKGAQGDTAMEVYLYCWSPTRPEAPRGSSVLNPESKRIEGYTPALDEVSVWALSIPNNPGGHDMQLWRASKLAVFKGGSSAAGFSWVGADVTNISMNGRDGETGVSSAVATLYCWSLAAPAAPTGPSKYHWGSGQITEIPAYITQQGWQTDPGIASPGQYLWVAERRILGKGEGVQAFNWAGSTVSSRSYAGSKGAAGASHMICYVASYASFMNQTTTKVQGKRVPFNYENHGGSGINWSTVPGALPNGARLWQSDGFYDPESNMTTWGPPYWSSFKVGDLSAITANMGTITAGVLRSNDGKFVIDLSNKRISIEV